MDFLFWISRDAAKSGFVTDRASLILSRVKPDSRPAQEARGDGEGDGGEGKRKKERDR